MGKQNPKAYAEALFKAIRDPDDGRFDVEVGTLGEGITAFFLTAETKDGEVKPVAIILTDEVRDVINEALELLFEHDDDDDETDEAEKPKRRSAFSP